MKESIILPTSKVLALYLLYMFLHTVAQWQSRLLQISFESTRHFPYLRRTHPSLNKELQLVEKWLLSSYINYLGHTSNPSSDIRHKLVICLILKGVNLDLCDIWMKCLSMARIQGVFKIVYFVLRICGLEMVTISGSFWPLLDTKELMATGFSVEDGINIRLL